MTLNSVGGTINSCHWQGNVFSSGHQCTSHSGPIVCGNNVFPDSLVMRALESSIKHELGSILDRDHLGMTQTLSCPLFSRQLIRNRFNRTVNWIPELHTLTGTSDNGNSGESICSSDQSASASDTRPQELRLMHCIGHGGPIQSDNFVSVDAASKESSDVGTNLNRAMKGHS
jgi:hypothetical protein